MASLKIVAECAGKFGVLCDETRGYIHFKLIGFVNEEESRLCYDTLATLWAAARERHGRVLFLVDASEAQVQAPALIAEMTGSNPLPVCNKDRLAFVVSSSLLKMQMKREIGNAEPSVGFFMSVNAAETWVLAFESECPARLAS